MALKSLGEIRTEIDGDRVITAFKAAVESQTGRNTDAVFDELYPKDCADVVDNVRLKTLAVLCGNKVAESGNGVAVFFGGMITAELLRISGLDKDARDMENDM